MKKFILLTLFCVTQYSILIYGQVSVSNNNAGGANYVGWDNSVAVPLEIRTNNTTTPQPIDFYTSSMPWMTLDVSGNLGISQTFPFAPQNQLHINGDNSVGSVPTRIQITDSKTNSTPTDGFMIGNVSNNGVDPDGTAQIIQNEMAPTIFYNWDKTIGGLAERLRFTDNHDMIDYLSAPTVRPDGLRIMNPGYATSISTAETAID